MTYRDQRKYFDILRKYEKKFTRAESEDYKILVQRHKDDEDLDKQSFERLKALYQKYYVHPDPKAYEGFFKKPEDTGADDQTQ